ncbi:MAG TPA: hypothetical protein EYM96_02055 [Rhodospirillales bacterium]|nr:hypothetical protein [Rhodospirillales bacterium]
MNKLTTALVCASITASSAAMALSVDEPVGYLYATTNGIIANRGSADGEGLWMKSGNTWVGLATYGRNISFEKLAVGAKAAGQNLQLYTQTGSGGWEYAYIASTNSGNTSNGRARAISCTDGSSLVGYSNAGIVDCVVSYKDISGGNEKVTRVYSHNQVAIIMQSMANGGKLKITVGDLTIQDGSTGQMSTFPSAHATMVEAVQ